MIATRRPVSRVASRMRPIISACFEKSPCEKFNRATFRPARMSRTIISGDSDAGPMVATIFVLCAGNAVVMTRTWCFASAHFAAVDRVLAQLFLDPQKLIVFRDAVGATERTGLYLSRIRGHGDVCNRGVFGLSRAMTDD